MRALRAVPADRWIRLEGNAESKTLFELARQGLLVTDGADEVLVEFPVGAHELELLEPLRGRRRPAGVATSHTRGKLGILIT